MGINYIFETPENKGDYFKMSYVGGEVVLTPTKRLKDTDIPTLTKKEAATLRVQQREERRLLKIQENAMPTHTPKEVAKKKKKTSKATPKKKPSKKKQ